MTEKYIDPRSSELSTTTVDEEVIFSKGASDHSKNEACPGTQHIDVVDPHTWPFWKKVFHNAVPALYGFTVTAGSSLYTPGTKLIAERFGVSREIAVLGLALYSEGLGLGPMIGAPISEAFGRKGVYLITGPLFMLFTLGAGLAQNIETLVICRLLAATFGSPALAVGAGTIADIWDMQHGGAIASVLTISTFFLGPSIGPTIGGFAFEQRHSWRWLMWVILLASGPILIVSLFTEETSIKHIEQRKAKKLGLDSSTSPSKAALKATFISTCFRPIKMIFREPIVLAWSLYHSFVFGTLFGFFGSYYYVFETVYHFGPSQVGLTFLGVFVGILLAIVVFILMDKLIYQKRRKLFADGKPPPEERLYACMFGAFCLPISLFWFGWTARADIHWISPVAAGVPFGCGMLLLFVGGVTYIMDTYGVAYSASAMAANGVMRYSFGMAFPLFTTQMYQRLGIAWATSLIGFVSLSLLPIPFVMYKYGPAMRARSIFVGSHIKH